jgi:uncharacterized protein
MKNLLRRGACLLLCAAAGSAVDWTAYKPEGYVSDFAKVIDPASRAQLNAYCAAVERATKAQIALVTVPSLEGEPIADVAYDMARAWGVGRKGENDGVLLLLAIQDRRSRLEVGSGLQSVLPDSMAGDILSEMRPALRRERYGDALMAAASTIGNTIAKARHVTIQAPALPHRVQRSVWDWLPWPVLVGGALLLVWLLFSGAPRGYGGGGWGGGGFLPWLILGSMMGRSTWGSRGSGGFGGYDSGDSFGGFGGGDFGGGGASGDW